MRDHFVRAITELAAADPSVVLITGDLGFGVLTEFATRFPRQYFNAGVAEQNMTAIATGLALEGRRVYTYSIANFATLRCLEQIRNDVCYHDANVTIVAIGGGFSYGQLGMSHFATEDLAMLRALPNMTVVAPSDPWEAYELAKQLYRRNGPAYVRIDKSAAGLSADPSAVELGRVRTLREGNDATIVAIGGIVREAIDAATQLARDGIEAGVLAVHTLKPLDIETIAAAVARTGVVVTVEEHSIIGGLGGAVAEGCLAAGVAPRAFRRIGLNDCHPTVVGDQMYLRQLHGLTSAAIADTVRQACSSDRGVSC